MSEQTKPAGMLEIEDENIVNGENQAEVFRKLELRTALLTAQPVKQEQEPDYWIGVDTHPDYPVFPVSVAEPSDADKKQYQYQPVFTYPPDAASKIAGLEAQRDGLKMDVMLLQGEQEELVAKYDVFENKVADIQKAVDEISPSDADDRDYLYSMITRLAVRLMEILSGAQPEQGDKA